MSNLKDPINIDACKEQMNAMVNGAKEGIDRFAKATIENLVEAQRALGALPSMNADVLLGKATVAMSREFEWPDQGMYRDENPVRLHSVAIEFTDRFGVELLNPRYAPPPDSPAIKPGKYRALLFILPIED
jgi:hypothetical protein